MTDKVLVTPNDLVLFVQPVGGEMIPIKLTGLLPGNRFVRCVREGAGFLIDLDPGGIALSEREAREKYIAWSNAAEIKTWRDEHLIVSKEVGRLKDQLEKAQGKNRRRARAGKSA